MQATNAGNRHIKIIYRDRINGSYSEPVWIKRALLAKFFQESRVIGSREGLSVVEI
jgi:hypothetical protein